MSRLAKALYDNTAECEDELAFRRGDILTVVDHSVAGTSGWWQCSLYGRHGLAPANRLQLLPLPAGTMSPVALRHGLAHTAPDVQNIYQIPSVPRPSSSPTYECMARIGKTSSTEGREESKCSLLSTMSGPNVEVYDVPVPARQTSAFTVYAVPPPLHQDPNYDIPVPCESQQKRISRYNPQKSEGIYNVPAGLEKQSPHQGSYDAMASEPECRQPIQKAGPAPSIYDIPKHSCVDNRSPPKEASRITVCYKPPNVVPPQEEPPPPVLHLPGGHVPLDCRGARESLVQEEDESVRTLHVAPADSQRISTASSSSTSSCDSLALSSSSPEPLREVTLSQDEACRRLVDLQASVTRAVSQLMDFVSSHWRRKEHLSKHLKEIKEAAEGIAGSLTCFLNFALDIKGNAYRLTDANLQTRLCKQLSIVEDSGVILQQTVGALATAGWPLSVLCQDSEQVQAPDQLDRFVMVVRTVPEDIKRLVSIINANGKLLFRPPQKDPESLSNTSQAEIKKSPSDSQAAEDDNDYVELQNESEKPRRGTREAAKPLSKKNQVYNKQHSCESSSSAKGRLSSMSEHCRLYFGALHKALGGFVSSLQDGQPPEKFISQSKLVIMVGQRLVDTLCREAQREGSNHSLLSKSNHLCALLKQLAVATKKAALHFPDKQALQEVQEFAKELAQRAQHVRISLDL